MNSRMLGSRHIFLAKLEAEFDLFITPHFLHSSRKEEEDTLISEDKISGIIHLINLFCFIIAV